jgi:hypothetical protein
LSQILSKTGFGRKRKPLREAKLRDRIVGSLPLC